MTTEQKPNAVEVLKLWHTHAEAVHGATPADYRHRILEWHREAFPSCDFSAYR